MRRLPRCLSLLALTLTSRAVAARPSFTPEELSSLDQGKVLESSRNVPGTKVMAGRGIILIPDKPEAVAYVVLELEKYKAFLPRIKDSRLVKKHGYSTFGVVETSLPWPAKDCWAYIKYTREDRPNRTFHVVWSMLNGNMKNHSGEATLEPWNKEGTKTLLTYEMRFEPHTAAPDSIVSEGVRKATSIMIQKIRLRVMALRKFGKMPKGY
jgi:ribosome-associated toxin RatA of RatAB toxin-antitoxin module